MKALKPPHPKKSFISGFTMIEIIIVLGMIATLTTSSVVGYSFFMQNSRDSRREVDLQTINTALQEYRLTEERYPNTLEELTESDPPYLEEIPTDPRDGEDGHGYIYEPISTSGSNSSFRLITKLENNTYIVINPFGTNTVANNPQNSAPTTAPVFATLTPEPLPPDPENTNTYTYYSHTYMNSHPIGDLNHYQYSNIVLNNVTNDTANVEIYIIGSNGQSLINESDHYKIDIPPKGQYNTYNDIENYLGINSANFVDNGRIAKNIYTPDPNDDPPTVGDPPHESALGWVKIQSDKPLTGYTRITLLKDPNLDSEQVDSVDEPLLTAGSRNAFYPVYVHDRETTDENYYQYTDLYIVNPNDQQTNVEIEVSNIIGIDSNGVIDTTTPQSESITILIEGNSSWSSWDNPQWVSTSQNAPDGGIGGSLEFTSTADVIITVRQRFVSKNNPSVVRFFDDEFAVPPEKTGRELVSVGYANQYEVDDETGRYLWSNIEVQNTENINTNITIEIYPNNGGVTPHATLTARLVPKGRWSSIGKDEWKQIEKMAGLATIHEEDPLDRWAAGWVKITSDNTNIAAFNRIVLRDPDGQTPSNTDRMISFDDELFSVLTDSSTNLFQTHYLRNWPGRGTVDSENLYQYSSPLLVNLGNTNADIAVTIWDIYTGDELHSFQSVIGPNSVWNGHALTDETLWYGAPENAPPDVTNATNAWAQISSDQPLFGGNQILFNTTASKNGEIYMFDYDNEMIPYPENFYACIDDDDCPSGKTCNSGECK